MCLLILMCIGIIFIKEGNNLNRLTHRSNCNHIFDAIFIVAEIAVFFDGVTACTVNYPDLIPKVVNLLLHWAMFVAYEIFVTLLFWYWVSVTIGISKKKMSPKYVKSNLFRIDMNISRPSGFISRWSFYIYAAPKSSERRNHPWASSSA